MKLREVVAKSLQYYMNGTDASKHQTGRYIKDLVIESWKKLNEIQMLNYSPIISKDFIEIALKIITVISCTLRKSFEV